MMDGYWSSGYGSTGLGDLTIWFADIQVVAGVLVFLVCVDIAWQIFGFYRRGQAASALSASRLFGLLAVLVLLCGIAHLGKQLAAPAPARAVPTALKVIAAVMWVIVATRLPALLKDRRQPSPALAESAAMPLPSALLMNSHSQLSTLSDLPERRTERPQDKARVLQSIISNDTWPLDREQTLRELKSILADLESYQCQT